MSKNKFMVNLNNSNLSAAKMKSLQDAISSLVAESLAEEIVTVDVRFSKSLGYANIQQVNADGIIAEAELSHFGGIVALKQSSQGNIISVRCITEGTATIKINVATVPATPVTMGNGAKNFRIQ